MKIEIMEVAGCEETEIIIRCAKVNDSLLKMVAQMRMYDQKITGIKDGETWLLEARRILYIDTVDRKTFFYTKDSVYETPFKLYELEERLAGEDFFRASKSVIVNFNQIRSLRPDLGGRLLLVMNNGEKLSVSKQYAPALKEKLGIR